MARDSDDGSSWILPVVVGVIVFFLVAFGALIFFTEGSAVAPFVYTLF